MLHLIFALVVAGMLATALILLSLSPQPLPRSDQTDSSDEIDLSDVDWSWPR